MKRSNVVWITLLSWTLMVGAPWAEGLSPMPPGSGSTSSLPAYGESGRWVGHAYTNMYCPPDSVGSRICVEWWDDHHTSHVVACCIYDWVYSANDFSDCQELEAGPRDPNASYL